MEAEEDPLGGAGIRAGRSSPRLSEGERKEGGREGSEKKVRTQLPETLPRQDCTHLGGAGSTLPAQQGWLGQSGLAESSAKVLLAVHQLAWLAGVPSPPGPQPHM